MTVEKNGLLNIQMKTNELLKRNKDKLSRGERLLTKKARQTIRFTVNRKPRKQVQIHVNVRGRRL